MNTLTTSFVQRLRARDESAWFELWETFGPVLRAQLAKWGRGNIGPDTVRDLTQDTLGCFHSLYRSLAKTRPNGQLGCRPSQ